MCMQGTKSKHAFIILTLICSQKCPSVENCETACLKDLRPSIFLLLIQRSWLCCNWIFKCKILQIPVSSVSFPWKNPNQPTSQKTHYGASCRHMKSFGLLSLAQITKASLVLKEISPLPTQPESWAALCFPLFPLLPFFWVQFSWQQPCTPLIEFSCGGNAMLAGGSVPNPSLATELSRTKLSFT